MMFIAMNVVYENKVRRINKDELKEREDLINE